MSSIRTFFVQVVLFFLAGAGCSSVDCDEVCADCDAVHSPYCKLSCENASDAASDAECTDLLEAYYQCISTNHEDCAPAPSENCREEILAFDQCFFKFCKEEPGSEHCPKTP